MIYLRLFNSMFSGWYSQSFLKRPSRINPFDQQPIPDIGLFRYSYQWKNFTFILKKKVLSSISTLLLHGRPSTVFFRIRPIIINAFYRSVSSTMFLYMHLIVLPHIVFKRLEALPKEFDSSSPVICIRRIMRIYTSLFYRLESVIKSELQWRMGQILSFAESVGNLDTSTGCLSTMPKRATGYNLLNTAITLAEKLVISTRIYSHFFNYQKLSKSFADQINLSHSAYENI